MPDRRFAIAGGAAVCLAAVAYAAAHPTAWVWHPPDWTPRQPTSIIEVPTLPTPENDGTITGEASGVWRIVLVVIAIIVAAAIVAVIVYILFRLVKNLVNTHIDHAPPPAHVPRGAAMPGTPLTPEQVVDAVAKALKELDDARTPTDAVIAAWLALEAEAKHHGIPRGLADTPTEFTSDLLRQSHVPEDDTAGLRRLYSRTRFSNVPATSDDVAAARVWLQHIAGSLEGATP